MLAISVQPRPPETVGADARSTPGRTYPRLQHASPAASPSAQRPGRRPRRNQAKARTTRPDPSSSAPTTTGRCGGTSQSAGFAERAARLSCSATETLIRRQLLEVVYLAY